MRLPEIAPDVINSYPGDDLMISVANHRRGLLRRSLRSNGRLFLKIRAIDRAPRVVMYRGSNMLSHAGQGTRAGELLQHEGVRARKRRTAPRRRELAYIDALRQSALLRRNARTVLPQS